MAATIFHMAAGAPSPVAPFSHAVEVDGWVLVTGQMPNDPADEAAPLPPTVEEQTRNVMRNLSIVLDSLGLGLEHVVMARVLSDPLPGRLRADEMPSTGPISPRAGCQPGPVSGLPGLRSTPGSRLTFW